MIDALAKHGTANLIPGVASLPDPLSDMIERGLEALAHGVALPRQLCCASVETPVRWDECRSSPLTLPFKRKQITEADYEPCAKRARGDGFEPGFWWPSLRK